MSRDAVSIRAAGPDDAAACVDILRDWIAATPWMPMLHDEASMRRFWRERLKAVDAWVAEHDADIVGFSVRDGEVVTALYVAEMARGRRVGRRLLEIAQTDRDRLSLWTFEANHAARRFYARLGWREIDRSPGENEEGLADVKLAWSRATSER